MVLIMLAMNAENLASSEMMPPSIGPSGSPLDAYNVVWDSPSDDQHGSMPIGNGDLAANVWVEPNGDLV